MLVSGRGHSTLRPMLLFRILLGIASAVALVVLFFFFWGLGDGSVSSFNILLWLTLLGGVAAIIFGGWALNASGRRGAACALLSILAVPGVLSALLLLSVLILQPRWN